MFSYAYEKNEKPEKVGGTHPPAGEGPGVWGWPALVLSLVLSKQPGDGKLLLTSNPVGKLHEFF